MKDREDRSDKGAETRESILKAAGKLFVQKGFDGASMMDVARKAKVTKGLLFYYFKNKQDLFDQVLDRYYRAQAESLMKALEGEGTLIKKIHQAVDEYLDFIEKNPGYPRLIQGEICSSNRNLKTIADHMKPLHQWGRVVFGQNFPPEGPLSSDQFFITLFGMMVNYYTYAPVLERLWEEKPLSKPALEKRRDHIHEIIEVLLKKYLKRKSP